MTKIQDMTPAFLRVVIATDAPLSDRANPLPKQTRDDPKITYGIAQERFLVQLTKKLLENSLPI
jgi:hypothetical protein